MSDNIFAKVKNVFLKDAEWVAKSFKTCSDHSGLIS